MQVIERKLVYNMDQIFNIVRNWDDEKVERLMDEDPEIEARRHVLREQLDSLERGLKICGTIARRRGKGFVST